MDWNMQWKNHNSIERLRNQVTALFYKVESQKSSIESIESSRRALIIIAIVCAIGFFATIIFTAYIAIRYKNTQNQVRRIKSIISTNNYEILPISIA